MVIDRLDGADAEKGEALARGHAGEQVGTASAEGVEQKALDGVVVEGAVGIGDVETVVAGVEVGWVELAGGRGQVAN